jgi:hypothetical protein
MLPRCRANKSKPVTLRHFSHWPRRIGSVGEGGLKSEGGKGKERVVGKAAGDECVFIPGVGPGWQVRSSSTPCRTQGVTGPLNRKR